MLATDGAMSLDIADVTNLENQGLLDEVIAHEMAHVLGIGTLWDNNNLYVNGTGQYTGAAALAAFQTRDRYRFVTTTVNADSSPGLLARGSYYEQIVQRSRTEQRAIFQEVFPQQRVPVGIRTRLESEHAKLAGMTGQQSELPDSVSAIATLHRVLASLPEGLPYRLIELRIEESGSVDLSAEVRTHGDGNQLATSLENGRLQVQPPQSRQLQSNLVAVEIAANFAKLVTQGYATFALLTSLHPGLT